MHGGEGEGDERIAAASLPTLLLTRQARAGMRCVCVCVSLSMCLSLSLHVSLSPFMSLCLCFSTCVCPIASDFKSTAWTQAAIMHTF